MTSNALPLLLSSSSQSATKCSTSTKCSESNATIVTTDVKQVVDDTPCSSKQIIGSTILWSRDMYTEFQNALQQYRAETLAWRFPWSWHTNLEALKRAQEMIKMLCLAFNIADETSIHNAFVTEPGLQLLSRGILLIQLGSVKDSKCSWLKNIIVVRQPLEPMCADKYELCASEFQCVMANATNDVTSTKLMQYELVRIPSACGWRCRCWSMGCRRIREHEGLLRFE